ncbi:LppU/SCO3897 family protein [Allostreptomyces psammosilenae]|uniref:Uncharacterized protein n=1 Tax=Allostreptomyces psammosilenae TaxID=1892865 RepID=A0A852ZXH1_9ACTN|nr:hypothetical protein [Allostreptomyces psammosilenae]NYI05424.1 hypothetical protein [Allostreptomyces psammosilenae]
MSAPYNPGQQPGGPAYPQQQGQFPGQAPGQFQGQPSPYFNQAGGPVPPQQPQQRRRSPMKLIRNVGIPVLGLIIAIGGFVANQNSDSNQAEVGDCVQNQASASDANLEIVDCSTEGETFLVLAKFEDTTDDSRCEEFPEYVASYTEVYGSSEFLLCLGEPA